MINFYGTRRARSSASATDIGLSNYPDRLEPLEQEWVMGYERRQKVRNGRIIDHRASHFMLKSPQWSEI
jgi:hypothetical protein